jgi:tetratricopeptide (TPR) repeat protein
MSRSRSRCWESPNWVREVRMLIFFGSSPKVRTVDPNGARLRCPSCGVDSKFVEKQVVTYFTLYFIPIFPMHRGEKFVECEYCHSRFMTPLADFQAAEAEQREESARQESARQAAAQQGEAEVEELLRTWRQQPDDRVALCRLLDLLAAQGRYHRLDELEGEIRARHGGDADVLLRLAHAAYALKRYDQAIRDYEALLAANPYRGDARFYLASSYWSLEPPDWDRALEHMRIATDMGFQPAVEALPKLERARAKAPLERP